MLQIIENSITMTRGDSVYFEIVCWTPDKKVYELEIGDKIRYCLRNVPNKNSPPLLEKVFKDNQIKLDPEDTNFLKYGRYFWDCTLEFNNGDINTIASGDITLTYNNGIKN